MYSEGPCVVPLCVGTQTQDSSVAILHPRRCHGVYHDPHQDGDIQIRTWIRSIGSVDLGILVAEMYHQRVGIWLDTYDLLLYPAGPPPRGEQPVGSRAALLVSTLVPSDDEITSMGHDPRWDGSPGTSWCSTCACAGTVLTYRLYSLWRAGCIVVVCAMGLTITPPSTIMSSMGSMGRYS